MSDRARNSSPGRKLSAPREAHRRSAPSHRRSALIRTTGKPRARCTSRSAEAISRMREFANRLLGRARRAGRRRGVLRRRSERLVKPIVATSRMANYHATPIVPLARGKVRYVGEPVVAVVAAAAIRPKTRSNCIAIDYEPLPVIVDAEEAARAADRCCTKKPARTCW